MKKKPSEPHHPRVRGAREYRLFMAGKRLTRGEAIKAMCYDCLGGEGMYEDCMGHSCPLYGYYPQKYKKIEIRTHLRHKTRSR